MRKNDPEIGITLPLSSWKAFRDDIEKFSMLDALPAKTRETYTAVAASLGGLIRGDSKTLTISKPEDRHVGLMRLLEKHEFAASNLKLSHESFTALGMFRLALYEATNKPYVAKKPDIDKKVLAACKAEASRK